MHREATTTASALGLSGAAGGLSTPGVAASPAGRRGAGLAPAHSSIKWKACPQAPRPLQCSPPRSARRRRRPQGAIPAGTGLGSAPRGAGGREGKRKGKGRERGGRRAPRSAGSPGSAPRPGPRGGRGARSRGGFGNAERGGGGKGRGAERRRRAEREGVGKQEGSCEPVWG